MRSAIETSGRRFLLAVSVGAALLGILVLLPASGEAHTKGPPAGSWFCAREDSINEEDWGDACFQPDGDLIWVRDQDRNGFSVRVQLQTNYGKTRWCANTHGAVSWHACNHNHREDGCVRWRMFEQNHGGETFSWTGWSSWWATEGNFTAGC